MVQVLQTWIFCHFTMWAICLSILQQTKASWEEKETQGRTIGSKGKPTSGAQVAWLRTQKLLLRAPELLSRAPQAAPCCQKAPSKGISAALVLLV